MLGACPEVISSRLMPRDGSQRWPPSLGLGEPQLDLGLLNWTFMGWSRSGMVRTRHGPTASSIISRPWGGGGGWPMARWRFRTTRFRGPCRAAALGIVACARNGTSGAASNRRSRKQRRSAHPGTPPGSGPGDLSGQFGLGHPVKLGKHVGGPRHLTGGKGRVELVELPGVGAGG